jgi:hypothetical protein
MWCAGASQRAAAWVQVATRVARARVGVGCAGVPSRLPPRSSSGRWNTARPFSTPHDPKPASRHEQDPGSCSPPRGSPATKSRDARAAGRPIGQARGGWASRRPARSAAACARAEPRAAPGAVQRAAPRAPRCCRRRPRRRGRPQLGGRRGRGRRRGAADCCARAACRGGAATRARRARAAAPRPGPGAARRARARRGGARPGRGQPPGGRQRGLGLHRAASPLAGGAASSRLRPVPVGANALPPAPSHRRCPCHTSWRPAVTRRPPLPSAPPRPPRPARRPRGAGGRRRR